MNFEDRFSSRADRYSLGVETESERYYASFPVSTGLVDYEEYYEITLAQFHRFLEDRAAAIEFVESCRRHERDELLMQPPGWNRGVPT